VHGQPARARVFAARRGPPAGRGRIAYPIGAWSCCRLPDSTLRLMGRRRVPSAALLAALVTAACVSGSPPSDAAPPAAHHPPLPPSQTPCGCVTNIGLQHPSPTNASLPMGWKTYTWNNSTFSWGPPPVGQCASPLGTAAAAAAASALAVTGGTGAWNSAALDLSSLPRDVGWADGTTAIVSVSAHFCANHVRAGAQLVAYFSAKGAAPLPGYAPDAGGTLGWATHDLRTSVRVATEVSFGDVRLPLRGSPELKLVLRLTDGPASATDEPPTTVFFTAVSVAAVRPPTPTGQAQALPAIGGVEMWSDHASHKVFQDAVAPPSAAVSSEVNAAEISLPGTMRGGTAATQLVFRAAATATRCSLHWDKTSTARGLEQALLVLSVNMSRVSGTYGESGGHPDPLLPLQPAMSFEVPPGVAQPVLLKVRVARTSIGGSGSGEDGLLTVPIQTSLSVQCTDAAAAGGGGSKR
jgi:hypothetical protein